MLLSFGPVLTLSSRLTFPELADRKHIKVPVLYIGTSQDAACVPAMFAGQKEWIADLTSKEYDATHWSVEEKVWSLTFLFRWPHEQLSTLPVRFSSPRNFARICWHGSQRKGCNVARSMRVSNLGLKSVARRD